MADTAEVMGSVEQDGLAHTLSVVGLAISQAADELQQAAERLSTAEERSREADARVTAAEEQVAEQAARVAEMLTLLQHAREAQIEAEERSREAEQGLEGLTERARQAEEQAEAADARVRALEEQVAELQGRLEEAETKPNVTVILDDERTALQEAVAAEVRRPLTSILGITLALKHADPKSVDGREMLRQLATNARKLDRLVGEMLDIERIAAGTFTPNLRRTDLEALVRRVVGESPDLANRDVQVQADHVAIQIDPGLTEQIVETLLANAGRRTVPGSSVWVTVAPSDGGAVIAVDDVGPEIPAGLRQAMFTALQDGDPEAQRVRGATGLSLLSRLVEIQGGRCWVQERTPEGSSFRVLLPDAVTGPEEPATDAHGSEEEPAPEVAEQEEEDADEEMTV
jgi:K+-sensing histidine kinase KdpD